MVQGAPPAQRRDSSGVAARLQQWALQAGRGQYVPTLQSAYHEAIPVYRCANIIARGVGRAPLELFRGEKKIESGPAYDLLQNPNPYMTQSQFVEHLAIQGPLGGNAYIWPHVGELSQQVVWLLPIPANQVTIERDDWNPYGLKGWTIRYRGAPTYVPADEMVHIPYAPDPTDPILGVSPLGVARLTAEMDYDAMLYNRSVVRNSGTPSGILKWLGDKLLDPGQRAEAQMQWQEAHSGPDVAGSTAVLNGNFGFEPVSIPPRDMQWIEARKMNLADIARAFNVPLVFLNEFEASGLSDAGLRVQEGMLYSQTIRPWALLIEQAITKHIVQKIEPDLVAVFNFDAVEALQPQMVQKLEQAKALKELGYPLNEINKALEMGMPDVEWGDESFINDHLTTATAIVELSKLPVEPPPSPPEAPPSPPPVPEEKPGATPDTSAPADGNAKPEEEKKAAHRHGRLMSPARRALWRAKDRQASGLYRSLLGKIRKDLLKQRKLVLTALEREHRAGTDDKKKTAADAMDLDSLRTVIKTGFKKAYTSGYEEPQQDLSVINDDPASYQLSRPEINRIADQFYDRHIDTVVEATDNIRKRVQSTLLEGQANGENLEDLRKRVQVEFNASASRARTIARTETQIGLNGGTFERYKRQGAEKIEWLSSRDEKVRDSHRDADGEIVPLGDAFEVGDSELQFPCDPDGPAEEIINCVLPGTMVSGRIVGALKAFYAGKAIEIETRRGHRVAVTVNHPVATERGILPAHALRKGDRVVCEGPNIDGGASRGDHQEQDAPAKVEQVFDALAARGAARIHRPRSFDLDGDARSVKGDVDVVVGLPALPGAPASVVNPGLMLPRNPTPAQLREQLQLIAAKQAPPAPALASGPHASTIVRGAAARHPGGAELALDLRGVVAQAAPLQELRLGPAARLDAVLPENARHDRARSADFFGELIYRSAGLVALDEVVSVREFDFLGHVYDLQTAVGYFNSGGVISRNCRCYTIAIVEELDNAEDPFDFSTLDDSGD